MDNILNVLKSILNQDKDNLYVIGLSVPSGNLDLHSVCKDSIASSDGCSGYSGHCSCTNNPCMSCSNAH